MSSNSRLERELLALRQKLQTSRNVHPLHASTTDCTADAFEKELRKAQNLVSDMQRQRDELSMAVSQLTLGSNPFSEAAKITSKKASVHPSSGSNKRFQSNWTETDLDSMYSKSYLIDSVSASEESSNADKNYYIDGAHAIKSDEYSVHNGKYRRLLMTK